MNWTSANIPSQKNKIAVITGANAGIGRETTRALSNKGAEIVMAVRTVAKGQKVADAVQNGIQSLSNRFVHGAADALTDIVMESPEMGAMPGLRAATDPQAKGGDYYGPGGFMGMRGYPEAKKPAKSADNEVLAQGLWERSAELTGVQYSAFQIGS